MEQSGIGNLPPTTGEPQVVAPVATEPDKVDVLAEQISRQTDALAQLVELQKSQVEAKNVTPKPELKPPKEFNANDLANPESETGQYFLGVLQEREERIAASIAKTYEEKFQAYEAEKQLENRIKGLRTQKEIADDRMNDFKQWMSDPKAVDMNTLYEVFDKKFPQQAKPNVPAARLSNSGGSASTVAGGKSFLGGLK